MGRRLITQEFYEVLNSTAAGLAATMIKEAGFDDFAKYTYGKFGELEARLRFKK
jgi:hypothetical protein